MQRNNGHTHQLDSTGQSTHQGVIQVQPIAHHAKAMARRLGQEATEPMGGQPPVDASWPPLRQAVACGHFSFFHVTFIAGPTSSPSTFLNNRRVLAVFNDKIRSPTKVQKEEKLAILNTYAFTINQVLHVFGEYCFAGHKHKYMEKFTERRFPMLIYIKEQWRCPST